MVDGRIDAVRIFAAAKELAFPRQAGSPGNDRAREILAQRLAECGLDVELEWFSYDLRPALMALRFALLASAALVLVAGWLAQLSAAAALAVLACGIGTGAAMLVWAPGAERLYRGEGPTRTANVVARRPATAEARSTLIVMAHYDSKSQSLTFPFRMGFTLLAIAGALGLALLLLPSSVGLFELPRGAAALLAVLSSGSLVVLSTMRSGNHSPGGVDNAGSVAIVLELARVLPGEVPPDIDLVFLCTSAEEDHMIGAMRFLDAHRAQLAGRPVRALNFDGAGAPGSLVLLESYGTGKHFAPEIADLAHRVARDAGQRLRNVWMPPAMGIDAIPFHHRGVPCLTFSSGSLGRATIAVHSSADVAEHLDTATLGRVAELARRVARRLAG